MLIPSARSAPTAPATAHRSAARSAYPHPVPDGRCERPWPRWWTKVRVPATFPA
ncbi:hypothetical protein [Ornithinimicrobium sp. CNJ-824]|uniref:hypothetical protein n=1 Tax=Ornithinimicrobium sp. CNJ-824 TaxID=1904966 RepID=UPI001EDC5898|nr:hypothetical protein [Ornithinimicrobium sp. CNJ-824]